MNTRRLIPELARSGIAVRLTMSIGSGLLLASAFPNFNLGLLAWVALVPLLLAVDGRRLVEVTWYSWLAGMVFYGVTFRWLSISLGQFAHKPLSTAFAEILLLSGIEASFMAAAFVAAFSASRPLNIPILATLPIAWPAIEWLRSFFPVPFPWELLGYAAYRDLRLVQFSEFTGVYGVSALMVLVNVAIYRLITGRQALRRELRAAAVAGGLVLVALAFGTLRLNQLERAQAAGKLRVAMVQGNIPQSLKWNPASLAPSFKVYADATETASRQHPDLIIWPETAAAFIFQPDNFYPVPLATQAEYRERVLSMARGLGEPLLFGAPALKWGLGPSTRNRAYLVSADGRVSGYYDKIVLVPFGEYVPMRSVLGNSVEKLVQSIGDITPGSDQTILKVKDARLAVLICYESIMPDLTRRAVKAGANVLVNITNDAWFGKSAAPYQLLAMAAMRSVETHTPMVRVANTGISAVISPTGRIIGATELFTRTTEIETVEWKGVRTFYTRFGDVFAESCFALLIMGLLWPRAWLQSGRRGALGGRVQPMGTT